MYTFQATGLDYAAPLSVKDTIGKGIVEKAYILLLTCATSRAIHLELTPDTTVNAFLRGFKRFTARRGTPDIIINDNFKTQGVKQKFILPASPWWGGFYERLVRTVKLSLKKIIGKALLTFEELQTVLCEVEKVINGRPLVYTSEDDLIETITPFHLMNGRNLLCKDKHTCMESIEMNLSDCSKRAKYLSKIISDYWTRFSSTYLNELRQRHMYEKRKSNNKNKLLVGDVVLIKDDIITPRMMWKIGKVEELVVVGKDNSVRGAILSIISKKGRRTRASRPLQKLIPFEIADENVRANGSHERVSVHNAPKPGNEQKHLEIDVNEIDGMPVNNEKYVIRPKRKAALAGQDMRRLRQLYN